MPIPTHGSLTPNAQPGDLATRVNSREQQHRQQRGRNGVGGVGSSSIDNRYNNNRRAVDRLDLGLGSLAIDPELPVASEDPDVWPPPTPDPSRAGVAPAHQGDEVIHRGGYCALVMNFV